MLGFSIVWLGQIVSVLATNMTAFAQTIWVYEKTGSETDSSEMKTFYCANVPVRQDGNPRFLHDKIIVLDNHIVISGSFNFSSNATENNDENVIIIDTTPAWKPVVEALRNLNPGGRLVINAIRKENFDKDYLLNLNYPQHLWMEKEIRSVANITRGDVEEFLRLAAEIPIRPETQEYRLEEANTALRELKERKIRGAKVLRIG